MIGQANSTVPNMAIMGVECPTCGRDDFDSERAVKTHHKMAHGESIAGVEVECTWCGESFRRKQSHVERVDHHFCSSECEVEWKRENQSGKQHPNWKGGLVETSCAQCGEAVEVEKYRLERSVRHFCSVECHTEWKRDQDLSGSNSAAWDGGLIEVECATCGTPKRVKPHRTHDYDRHFCSMACKIEWQQIHQSGEGNPRWTGGSEVYSGVLAAISDRSWDAIAAEVRKRDEVCQMCGKEPERDLDVHHIVPLRAGGVNDPELLIALCRSCHIKTESYTQRFTEPVLVE